MAVQNGQPVNAQVTNAAFVSRTQDSSTIGKVGLSNSDPVSGDPVANTQRAINKAFEGIGSTGEVDSAINDYDSNNFIDNGDDRKVAIEKIDTQLFDTQTQLDALDTLNSRDVTAAPVGALPNANGFTITPDQIVNLQPANATNPGVITALAQSIGGNKTFTNNVAVTGSETVGGNLGVTGATTLSGLSVTGNETVGGTLGVTGSTSVSTLSSSGAATLNSAVVSTSATVGSTLSVTGNTSLSTASTSGLATLDSLTVTNGASVGGALTVTGNLTVNGTTTTINSTTISTADKNIETNIGGNDAASEGSGLTISRSGTKGSIVYKATSATKFASGDLGSEIDLVGTTSTQTLTNKTLSSPSITTPTGITKNDVGLGNVDNTSDATKNAATATLTNKTLTSPVITTPTGITKSDVGLGNVDNTSDATKNTAIATLTNKTLTSAVLTTPSLDILSTTEQGSTPATPGAGIRKLYSKNDGFYQLTSAGVETKIGTGTGSGSGGSSGVNFVTNPDAETGTTGWFGDSFAAAARPSGALQSISTGVTFTSTSSAPLAGLNSFLFSKDAVNRQGRVYYTNLTITPAYFAKVLNISFDYLVNSGTFIAGSSTSDSDIIVYLQDSTNNTFIEPSSFKFLSNSTSISDKFQGTFQTSSTGTSYRLMFYVASTSALAYSVKIDNVAVSPSNYIYGTPITDWRNYTPTFTGFGTVSVINMQSRRVGDSLDVKGYFQVGTVSSTAAAMTLGYNGANGNVTVDSKIGAVVFCGNAISQSINSSTYFGSLTVLTTNPAASSSVNFGAQISGQSGTTAQGGTTLVSNNVYVSVNFSVPIVGWSSSVQMSDQTDTRVYTAKAKISAPKSVSNTLPINFDNVNYDTHGAITVSSTAWKFTAQSSGFFDVIFDAASAGTVVTYYVFKNGVSSDFLFTGATSLNNGNLGAATQIQLNAGDYLDIRTDGSAVTINNATVTISRRAGPSSIAATESNRLKYQAGTGQSLPNATATALTFTTKGFDTHGQWNGTNTATIQIAGKYRVKVMHTNICPINSSATNYLRILINGSTQTDKVFIASYLATGTYTYTVDDEFDLVAGTQITAAFHNGYGANATTDVTLVRNHIIIERMGN